MRADWSQVGCSRLTFGPSDCFTCTEREHVFQVYLTTNVEGYPYLNLHNPCLFLQLSGGLSWLILAIAEKEIESESEKS